MGTRVVLVEDRAVIYAAQFDGTYCTWCNRTLVDGFLLETRGRRGDRIAGTPLCVKCGLRVCHAWGYVAPVML